MATAARPMASITTAMWSAPQPPPAEATRASCGEIPRHNTLALFLEEAEALRSLSMTMAGLQEPHPARISERMQWSGHRSQSRHRPSCFWLVLEGWRVSRVASEAGTHRPASPLPARPPSRVGATGDRNRTAGYGRPALDLLDDQGSAALSSRNTDRCANSRDSSRSLQDTSCGSRAGGSWRRFAGPGNAADQCPGSRSSCTRSPCAPPPNR